MKFIRKGEQLLDSGFIQSDALKDIEKVIERFSMSITPDLQEIIKKEGVNGPIGRQFIPSSEELKTYPEESTDPSQEQLQSPVKGIIHRYPDRCLLMPINSCPVYCRFCFRRSAVGAENKLLTRAEMTEAFAYIKSRPEIWEVILSGGDPLFLNPKKLSGILKKLEAIETVEIIRIHTRVPMVDSKRITQELVQALKIRKPVYVILHSNHPNEFTEQSKAACALLVDAGIPMLSQSVLLKGINDDADTLLTLMRQFVINRIKPYYLHHGDLTEGTRHFRTTLQVGQQLMKSIRGFSGLCQPTYVLDIPGGYGKVPIGPTYFELQSELIGEEEGCYCIQDHQGKSHEYPPRG